MKHLGTKTIETERLILRKFTPFDAGAMFENWASDPEVTKYLTWEAHKTVETSAAIISEWVKNYKRPDYYQWAIELKGVGPIGSIGVVDINMEIRSAEVGYCIGRKFWGKGIMPEALKAVLDFLFDEAHFLRVMAKHDVMNPNSGRVMTKAGMKYEGTHRQAGYNNRGIIDVAIYAMIKEDRN